MDEKIKSIYMWMNMDGCMITLHFNVSKDTIITTPDIRDRVSYDYLELYVRTRT